MLKSGLIRFFERLLLMPSTVKEGLANNQQKQEEIPMASIADSKWETPSPDSKMPPNNESIDQLL